MLETLFLSRVSKWAAQVKLLHPEAAGCGAEPGGSGAGVHFLRLLELEQQAAR